MAESGTPSHELLVSREGGKFGVNRFCPKPVTGFRFDVVGLWALKCHYCYLLILKINIIIMDSRLKPPVLREGANCRSLSLVLILKAWTKSPDPAQVAFVYVMGCSVFRFPTRDRSKPKLHFSYDDID